MLDRGIRISAAPLAFLDFETTGLNPSFGHRVIEVGIVRCLGETVTQEYRQLVNPQRASDPGAYRVHHISPEMVRDAPLFAEIVDDVLALLEGAVIICHNASFDLGFLRAELARAGRPLPRLMALDTLALAQACWDTPSYSLDNLCRALRIRKIGHSALGDAQATRQLFLQIGQVLAGWDMHTLAEYAELQGRLLDWRHIRRASTPMEPPPLIRQAMEAGALLWIRYQDARGGITERTVRPIEVTGQRGQGYLRAYCMMRREERTFSLSGIREMRLIESDEA
jgi:DNA polymerase-3 subunit epsilon